MQILKFALVILAILVLGGEPEPGVSLAYEILFKFAAVVVVLVAKLF